MTSVRQLRRQLTFCAPAPAWRGGHRPAASKTRELPLCHPPRLKATLLGHRSWLGFVDSLSRVTLPGDLPAMVTGLGSPDGSTGVGATNLSAEAGAIDRSKDAEDGCWRGAVSGTAWVVTDPVNGLTPILRDEADRCAQIECRVTVVRDERVALAELEEPYVLEAPVAQEIRLATCGGIPLSSDYRTTTDQSLRCAGGAAGGARASYGRAPPREGTRRAPARRTTQLSSRSTRLNSIPPPRRARHAMIGGRSARRSNHVGVGTTGASAPRAPLPARPVGRF